MIKSKSILCALCIALTLFPWAFPAWGEGISAEFTERFNALVPAQNSSVHSDYLFEQIALGGEYTVRGIDLLHSQNRELNEKYDRLFEKFDTLIKQNDEIILLLKKIEKGKQP